MEIAKIHSKYSDTGHWIALCNHDTGLIELNRRDFPRLSALMKDYIWCHEYAHLLYDVYDEAQCNAIADQLFIERAKTPGERREREAFVRDSGSSAVSGIAITAIIGLATTAVSLGVKGYKVFVKAKEGQGYYALSAGERYLLVKDLLNASFEAARKGGSSAKDLFWSMMLQLPSVEADYDAWLSNNSFANGYIAECEKAYGFSFTEMLPTSYWSKPIVKVLVITAAIAAIALVAYKIIKKRRL